MTCENNSSGEFPKKGGHPTRNSYKIIPIDHQSTGFPEEKKEHLIIEIAFSYDFLSLSFINPHIWVQIHIKLSNCHLIF